MATDNSSSSSSNLSSSTASSVQISTVMGLFNTTKNEKFEKVDKSEEHNDGSPSKSHHRSSKHPSNKFGAIILPMPQPSFLPNNANYFTPNLPYSQGYFPHVPQYKYRFPSNCPYDLTKYGSPSTGFNPFMSAQTAARSFPPIWSNGISQFNDRSPFQQPLNIYQQNPWSYIPPSTNALMPPMHF